MLEEIPPYLFLTVFLGLAVAFPLLPIGMAALWGRAFTPGKPGQEKNASYECGIASKGFVNIQFRSQYYIYGIIFLVFDVEAAFLLPVAVAFLDLPLGGVLAALIFMLLLVEGLAWAWMKGVLVWK